MSQREISPPPLFSLQELILRPDLINLNRQPLEAVISATEKEEVPLNILFTVIPLQVWGRGLVVFCLFAVIVSPTSPAQRARCFTVLRDLTFSDQATVCVCPPGLGHTIPCVRTFSLVAFP